MSVTKLAEVADQIQKYWSPLFTKQLRESLLLGGLVDKRYEGAITKGGDTVRVSQVNAPTGQLLTVGTDADSFDTEAVSTNFVDIKADKRAVAAYEFEDLVSLQSQIAMENPEVMESLRYAMAKQINDYLYSLTAPSTSAPDHVINSVTDFNAAQLAAVRLLAAQAKWPNDGQWYCIVDPSYYSDLLNAQTLVSSDFGAQDAPVIGGQIALRRFGFNTLEDNSRATDKALIFHPSYLHMVSQPEVQVKISDMHSSKKFGMVMSVDMVFGAKLGIEGSKKHISVVAAASGS
jgi:hypothetical protein